MVDEHIPNVNSESQNKPSVFDVLTPAQTFVGGAITGFLLLCTIGFFIFLTLFLTGGLGTEVVEAETVKQNGVQQQDTTGGASITIRDVDPNKDHIRGNKDARISIITFSDYECPFCKRFHGTMSQIMQKYGSSVRWIYRNYPIDGLHAKARTEALASECAAEQGKYWEFVDLIFSETNGNDSLNLDKLPDYASEVGVTNISQFKTCVSDKKYASKVQEDERDAESAGARGTPYSIMITPNGEKIPINGAQPESVISQLIEQYK